MPRSWCLVSWSLDNAVFRSWNDLVLSFDCGGSSTTRRDERSRADRPACASLAVPTQTDGGPAIPRRTSSSIEAASWGDRTVSPETAIRTAEAISSVEQSLTR